MSAATVHLARLDRSLARHGETITLQRLATSGSTGAVTVVAEQTNVPAFVRSSAPQDLVEGGVRDITVVVSASGIGNFGLPIRDDRVIAQGDPSNIEQIQPIYIGSDLIRINMRCRG